MFKFKKKSVVGISISPELGLEIAEVNFPERRICKYTRTPLAYDYVQKNISDIDIFKEHLQELLLELAIPKGADIVLNVPSAFFEIKDYPASLTNEQIGLAIEESLNSVPIFSKAEPIYSYAQVPIETMQFNRYVYAAVNKTTILEIALFIEELGYNIINIDVSVNSILNALVYNNRIDLGSNKLWTLLIIDNSSCRILTMQDSNYVETFEEPISIGEVLGDEENYATVLSAIGPILDKTPTERLYILSNTSLICASKLAQSINFPGQIIHQDVNSFATETYLEIEEDSIDSNLAKTMSLEVIGAAVKRELQDQTIKINLFNHLLGDLYFRSQPPEIIINNKKYILTNEKLVNYGIIYLVVLTIIALLFFIPLATQNKILKNSIEDYDRKIKDVETFLKKNNDISTSLFDEGDEIKIGLAHNKKIYTYYTLIGSEIPEKLWLTGLQLGKNVTIKGQADNIESIYSFFRNLKDYNLDDKLKLQKLGLASGKSVEQVVTNNDIDGKSLITSMNADFYEFVFSNTPEVAQTKDESKKQANTKNSKQNLKSNKNVPKLGALD